MFKILKSKSMLFSNCLVTMRKNQSCHFSARFSKNQGMLHGKTVRKRLFSALFEKHALKCNLNFFFLFCSIFIFHSFKSRYIKYCSSHVSKLSCFRTCGIVNLGCASVYNFTTRAKKCFICIENIYFYTFWRS